MTASNLQLIVDVLSLARRPLSAVEIHRSMNATVRFDVVLEELRMAVNRGSIVVEVGRASRTRLFSLCNIASQSAT